MLQLARDTSNFAQTLAAPESADYGAWTGYRIPEDRSEWHPLVRSFFEYWLSVSPPGRLPGRQHIAPEDGRCCGRACGCSMSIAARCATAIACAAPRWCARSGA